MLGWTREVKNHKIKLPASVLTRASVDPLAATTTTRPRGSTAALTWPRRLISWHQIIAKCSSLTGKIHSTLLNISTIVHCKSDTRARRMMATTAKIIVSLLHSRPWLWWWRRGGGGLGHSVRLWPVPVLGSRLRALRGTVFCGSQCASSCTNTP